MNQRIFKLAKQADLIQWDTLPSGARTPDHESVVKAKKFAELIVRECARIADDGCGSACFGLGINGAMLLQHFGVE